MDATRTPAADLVTGADQQPEAQDAADARRLWARLEVVHTVVYFSPVVADAHARVGLEPGLMAYTAARVGPLGPVGPRTAAAVFYGFSPTALAEVLPSAWEWATPDEVVEATRAAVTRTLAPFAEGLEDEVVRAAELARQAAELQPLAGRPMAAARSELAWPDEPVSALWEAATRIREARGDGHVACLVAADVGGIESHLLPRGDGERLRAVLGPRRGWRDPEWDAALRRLQARGLLDADGAPTPRGAALHAEIEQRTDRLAAAPWTAVGTAITGQLEQALDPLVERLCASGLLPGVVTRRITG
ncbi:SCO6745 family protein [Egicoccus halophilus]|uniref:SalK n=1 Tax=Egicoccus halophilus TaxID=1670830 RepID=A0A8J3AD96_9ACTN|nr:hypothetical protein [Egicoccus halophilus]GGI09273.1 hypothetical protein GCM10011354_33260 [Egicoccus halophilus]